LVETVSCCKSGIVEVCTSGMEDSQNKLEWHAGGEILCVGNSQGWVNSVGLLMIKVIWINSPNGNAQCWLHGLKSSVS
jgi:hypothetical protein